MNLQQLRIFVLTVQHRKLTFVAKKMKVTQPTVTFHLNKLQEELGLPLFITGSKRLIKLTEVGNSFYHYARQIVATEDEMLDMLDDFRGLQKGIFSLGATYTPATYILPHSIAEFKAKYPQIDITLEVNTAGILLNMLKNYELDLAILSRYQLEDEELVFTPFAKDDLIFICSPCHPLAEAKELTAADLQGLPLIRHEQKSASRKLVDSWAAEMGIAFKDVMEVSATETMKALVKQQLGVAIISEKSCEEERKKGELAGHSLPGYAYKRYIYLVRRKSKLVSPTLKAFLDMKLSLP